MPGLAFAESIPYFKDSRSALFACAIHFIRSLLTLQPARRAPMFTAQSPHTHVSQERLKRTFLYIRDTRAK
jgi:hypothetical protein